MSAPPGQSEPHSHAPTSIDSDNASSVGSMPDLTSAPGETFSDEMGFAQFLELPEDVQRRIWHHYCPELDGAPRILHFELLEADVEAETNPMQEEGDGFFLYAAAYLQRQTDVIRKMLQVSKHAREIVYAALPDTLDFKRQIYASGYDSPCTVAKSSIPYNKESDIVWLDLPPGFRDFHYPAHLNTFRFNNGVKAAQNVGFNLEDGRATLSDPMVRDLAEHLLKQFPNLHKLHYGIYYEDLVESGREHYADWCFVDENCHEIRFSFHDTPDPYVTPMSNVIWRWPRAGSMAEELIPVVISKSLRPIQPTIDQLGLKCIPVFEFENEFHYDVLVEDGIFDPDLPDLPEGSDISESDHGHEGIGGCDGSCPVHGAARRGESVCGSRSAAPPYELRDWGTVDKKTGYQDSDAGEPLGDNESPPAFHKFNDLPIELRYRIWETYCPELSVPARVFEFEILGFGPMCASKPSNYRAIANDATKNATRKIRKVLAVHNESRNLALKCLPDTLDFGVSPQEELMIKGKITSDPIGSLRFRKETDVVVLRDPPQWTWFSLTDPVDGHYNLPNFANIVHNLAVGQPIPFVDDAFLEDIEHLVNQFPNLSNYYYIVHPSFDSAKNMKWSVAPETTRYRQTRAELTATGEDRVRMELWCWLTKDAASSVKLKNRVERLGPRLKRSFANREINMLPMISFDGEHDSDKYFAIVDAEEETRLRAANGVAEPESDADETESQYGMGDIYGDVETFFTAVLNGHIPGGMPLLDNILEQAGIDPQGLHDAIGYPAEDDEDWSDSEDDFGFI